MSDGVFLEPPSDERCERGRDDRSSSCRGSWRSGAVRGGDLPIGRRVLRGECEQDRNRRVGLALQPRHYRTSMMGKYLNGYGVPKVTTVIPPGWSDWTGAGNAYREFNYDLNQNGKVVHYGGPPPPPANAANYLTDVLASRATAFI